MNNQQLRFRLDYEMTIPLDGPVRQASALLEELEYRELYRAYSRAPRKSQVEPRVMFKVLAYAYMNEIDTTRKIEEACPKRIDFMRLLRDQPIPKHCAIARFRSGKNTQAAIEDLFYQYVRLLEQRGETEHQKAFIDATFMHMKQDPMRNGQLKPGYNAQLAVNSEYITGLAVFSNRTGYGVLVPFLTLLFQKHNQEK